MHQSRGSVTGKGDEDSLVRASPIQLRESSIRNESRGRNPSLYEGQSTKQLLINQRKNCQSMMNDSSQHFESNYMMPQAYRNEFGYAGENSYMSLRNQGYPQTGASMVNLRGILERKVVNYD
jgi:hypothetical protein